MIHFKYTSEGPLTILITEDFSHPDTERIALFLEGTYDVKGAKKVIFQVESDLPRERMRLLGDFCRRLPYECYINLEYPILEWQV